MFREPRNDTCTINATEAKLHEFTKVDFVKALTSINQAKLRIMGHDSAAADAFSGLLHNKPIL